MKMDEKTKKMLQIGFALYAASKIGPEFLVGLAVGYYIGKKGIPTDLGKYLPRSEKSQVSGMVGMPALPR